MSPGCLTLVCLLTVAQTGAPETTCKPAVPLELPSVTTPIPRPDAELPCDAPKCETCRPTIIPTAPTTSAPIADSGCWYDPDRRSFYFKSETLLWWVNGFDVPPLVTTSQPQDVGFLGRPTTQDLFGDNVDRGAMFGGRITAGYWLEEEHALELSGFFFLPPSENASFSGSQNPVLVRPFFSLNRNQQFGEIVSFPGTLDDGSLLAGDLLIHSPMTFFGVEGNVRCNLCCANHADGKGYRVDLLVGARYLDLDEGLTILENIVDISANRRQITVADSFDTANQFYGGQVGLDAEVRKGRWSFGTRAKLALGMTHQSIDVDGSQRIVSLVNGSVQNFRGGLLALDSNIGSHSRDRFSFVPEVTMTVGYNLLDHVRIYGGYNFLYWSNVVRPGDQIGTTLDESRIPNFNPAATRQASVRPVVPFKTSDFTAQGLLLGLEVRY